VAVAGDAIALGAMGEIPLRATAVEEALRNGAAVREAAQLADRDTSPSSDIRASADYRRHLARVLTEDALVDSGR
jgi:carbon-monoxide dehydrogenase medium subunit